MNFTSQRIPETYSQRRFVPYTFKNLEDYIFKKRKSLKRIEMRGFPGGTVVENLPASAGDTGSSPGLGRSHMPRSN